MSNPREGLESIVIRVPRELRNKFKSYAAENSVSMNTLIKGYLYDLLKSTPVARSSISLKNSIEEFGEKFEAAANDGVSLVSLPKLPVDVA